MRRAIRPTLCALALALSACRADDLGRATAPVIGGEPTVPGEYPATGALMIEGQFFCTGTLIAPTVVLTAGHCLDDSFLGGQVPGFTLVADATSAQPAEIVAGAARFQHPQFDINLVPTPGIGQWYDLAILTLAQPITSVAPEALPTLAEDGTALVTDAPVELVGYGLTDQAANLSGVKAKGTASLVEAGAAELLISKTGEQQNCYGDSGGPGFVELAGGGRRLVGIVSRGPDDSSTCDHGGVDTRVDAYLDWIASTIAAAEVPDAGPVVPDAGVTAPDAGDPAAEGGDTGGCCAVAGGRPVVPWPAWLAGLGCAWLVRRLRRR